MVETTENSNCAVDRKSWSLQYIFDIVVDHLRTQGKPSITGGICRYRDTNGYKCAAGFLIPDEDYNFKWEDTLIHNLNWFNDHFTESQLNLIAELQQVHDKSAFREKYNENFLSHCEAKWKLLASRFNLEYKCPTYSI